MNEDDAMLWQEVLDEVAAERVQNLRCPFCRTGQILLDENPQRTRLECASCRRFVEGRMGNR